MKYTALDVENGDIVIIDGTPRKITSADVHMFRGDGIPDGYIRLCWEGGTKTIKHTTIMKKES